MASSDEAITAAPDGPGAAEYAYVRLREAILSGRMQAGSEFSQVQLSREFGISRTPLREAIRRLQQEGLLVGEVNRRVRVAAAELAEFDTLCAVRIVNEALAIRLTVPHLGDEDVERIDAMRRRMEEGEAQSAEPWWEDVHRDFHRALTVGGTGRIRATLDNAYDHAFRFRSAFEWWGPPIREGLPTALREHVELMQAVRGRRAQESAEILARHYAAGALRQIHVTDPLFDASAVRNALAIVLRQPSGPAR